MTLELTFEELIALYDALVQYDNEYAYGNEHKIYFNLIAKIEKNKALREYFTEKYKNRIVGWEPYTEEVEV